ncbi:MAG: FAD-dependent oxidoreductase, partial [Planctomycetota bacterium]
QRKTCFEDSVGKGVVEHHVKKHKGEKAWSAQVLSDETYDIPYRCLVPQKVDGLLMGSGRSVSQQNPFLLRVMAMTMVVGQAAGAAAAVAARAGVSPRYVDIKALQNELKQQGVNV